MYYFKVLLGILFIAASGLSFWSFFLAKHPHSISEPQNIWKIDAVMENVTAWIMDPQGKPRMKLTAPKMVHYAKNDTTYVSSPQLVFYRPSQKPWFVTSKFARASQGAHEIFF